MALTCHLKISLHRLDKIWKCKRTIVCVTYNLLLKTNSKKNTCFLFIWSWWALFYCPHFFHKSTVVTDNEKFVIVD